MSGMLNRIFNWKCKIQDGDHKTENIYILACIYISNEIPTAIPLFRGQHHQKEFQAQNFQHDTLSSRGLQVHFTCHLYLT